MSRVLIQPHELAKVCSNCRCLFAYDITDILLDPFIESEAKKYVCCPYCKTQCELEIGEGF